MANMGHYTSKLLQFPGANSFGFGLFLRVRLTPPNLEKLRTCKNHSLFYPCFKSEVTNPEISYSSYRVQMPDQLTDQEGLCQCSIGVCLGQRAGSRWKDTKNPNGPSHVSCTHPNFINGPGKWVPRALSKQEEIGPDIYK